jgi:hypothetical protein
MKTKEVLKTLFPEIDVDSQTCKTIIESFDPCSDRLLKRWQDSEYKDFGIYEDADYYKELFICYQVVSKYSSAAIVGWLKKNHEGWEDLSFFDDYNGYGLTTLNMMERGVKKIKFFNDVEWQVNNFRSLLYMSGIQHVPTNDLGRKGKYDVVCSFEVAEHYEEPSVYLEKILSMVNPGGYYVQSTCYANMFAGHFPFYKFGDQMIKNKSASRKANQFVRDSGFELKFVGYNGKPYIYKRIES